MSSINEKKSKYVYISVHGWFRPYWSFTQDPGMRTAIGIVHILYSKIWEEIKYLISKHSSPFKIYEMHNFVLLEIRWEQLEFAPGLLILT